MISVLIAYLIRILMCRVLFGIIAVIIIILCVKCRHRSNYSILLKYDWFFNLYVIFIKLSIYYYFVLRDGLQRKT